MDGRKNNKGTKNNKGGNPGYGKLEFIRKKVDEFCPLWWQEWEAMMNSKPDEFVNDNVKEILQTLLAKGEKYTVKEIIEGLAKGAFQRKQFAMTEFNKLQMKMLPTIVGGDEGNPLILQFDETFRLTSKTKGDRSVTGEV